MRKTMRSKIIVTLLVCLVLVSCDLFNPKKPGNVVVIEGPTWEDAGDSFSLVGRVQNIGEGRALSVKIFVSFFDTENNPLITAYDVVDKINLDPGETSPFSIDVNDPDYEIRDLMDPTNTTYDISWSDED